MDPITTTIEGAKQATGLGVTKIYELIGQGKLETVKVGRRTLVKTKSIRALLGEQEAA
jgi:excisionase family DNA binding protein